MAGEPRDAGLIGRETKGEGPLLREFLGHERIVGTLYGAVKPDPAELEFADRVSTLAAIADANQTSTLEFSTNLVSSWTDAPNLPPLTNGTFRVNWPNRARRTYFRLRNMP